jgi:hypothetical protein
MTTDTLATAEGPAPALGALIALYGCFAIEHPAIIDPLISEARSLPEPGREAIVTAQRNYVAELVHSLRPSPPRAVPGHRPRPDPGPVPPAARGRTRGDLVTADHFDKASASPASDRAINSASDVMVLLAHERIACTLELPSVGPKRSALVRALADSTSRLTAPRRSGPNHADHAGHTLRSATVHPTRSGQRQGHAQRRHAGRYPRRQKGRPSRWSAEIGGRSHCLSHWLSSIQVEGRLAMSIRNTGTEVTLTVLSDPIWRAPVVQGLSAPIAPPGARSSRHARSAST